MNDENLASKQILKNNYDKLKRKQDQLNSTSQRLTEENRTLKERNLFLEKQTQNADTRVWIYKQAVKDNIDQSREVHDGMVKDIKELKAKIKELEG